MGNPIKKALFDHQLNRCHKAYEDSEKFLMDPYEQWIRKNESARKGKLSEEELGVQTLPLSRFCTMVSKGNLPAEQKWLCVLSGEGNWEMPSGKYREVFEQERSAGLIYGDEDMYDPRTGARYGAWFKPDESPETLMSFFCYGSQIFLNVMHLSKAVQAFRSVYSLDECTHRQYFYDLILFYTDYLRKENIGICHVSEVLFHGKGKQKVTEDLRKPEAVNEAAYWGYEPEYDACKLAAILRSGQQAVMKHFEHGTKAYSVPVYEVPTEEEGQRPLVSVIIPSKDNVEMLSLCVGSIREKTDFDSYEIIIVDNGSTEENKKHIEKMREKYHFRYIYEPMEFHFSKMCNLGAENAEGSFYLFLNDDIEVSSADWMRVLAGQAACEKTGAAGAKLLYPDSDLIQHVGISQIAVGPVHKLQKCHDAQADYYYGRNTVPYNVIGVTAACLMVRKEKFWEAGGFPMEAAVAYNDVELCFGLYELGYRNVVRNDIILYHHESVSRGDDRMDDAKWERLLVEKAGVYERHLALKGKDPYYNVNLSGFKPQFFCNYLYGYEQKQCYSSVAKVQKKIKEEWHNDCLIINLEHACMERKTELADEEDVYILEGWAYVLNMDNSRYEKHVYLIDESGSMWKTSFWERYRPDVVDILGEQEHISLSGFSCRIRRKDLKPGKYKMALLYRDCCSRQRLYKECEEAFLVE